MKAVPGGFSINTDLPIPPHFVPESAGRLWPVPYLDRAREAEAWAEAHGVRPAVEDDRRTCLLLIDVQNSFCLPGFELFVGGVSGNGAVEDSVRICRFIYRNLSRITEIVATLDTHAALQIFHPIFFRDALGEHPAPVTQISAEDLRRGAWRPDPDVARSLAAGGCADLAGHVAEYTARLAAGGKYSLMVWPYHAMLGSIGHALVPAVEEAIFFHSIARKQRVRFEIKGDNPLTEHYSALGPEVGRTAAADEAAAKNRELVRHILAFDAVYVAGQAKSHCVSWTVQDLLDEIGPGDAAQAGRVHLLEDCTSPVVVPGAVDFSGQASEAFSRFQSAGMKVARSDAPLDIA